MLKEKCGIFAIANHPEATLKCASGIHSLQHRGHEGFGVVSITEEGEFKSSYGTGHVKIDKIMRKVSGKSAIGHVRYSTSGNKDARNSLKQPIFCQLTIGKISIAHNGNLTNAKTLRNKLMSQGCIFQSDVDTEIILHLIALSPKPAFKEKIIDALEQIEGAYSLIIMTNESIMGVRDPFGIRPLVLGKIDKAYVLASESCALNVTQADFIRDVEPGELIVIQSDSIESSRPLPEKKPHFCIFEYIYFARPDSVIDNLSVYKARKNIGYQLALEDDIYHNADVVIPVPDSGLPASIGYSQKSSLPLELGIIKDNYINRTFIEPNQIIRTTNINMKHNVNKEVIQGQRIILIDDSIVRGNTMKKIIEMLQNAGAKEIHLRISSPPILHPCFYGIDTPEHSQLIAANHSINEIQTILGVDSIMFLSIEGLYEAINTCSSYCSACFSGNYPISVDNI